jgi:nucleoside diphosphate kinase
MNNNSLERTLSIIKPDAVERELGDKNKKNFPR